MDLPDFLQSLRGKMKTSRCKIWLRAFLLVQFSLLFSIYFVRDIASGYFTWGWTVLTIFLFVPVGFLLSRIVPMKINLEIKAVTLSIDKIYLVLIWVLVITKLIAGTSPATVKLADVIMCAILGIMGGRLGGIGVRVRNLKKKHGLTKA